jgi:hypothetical protein
VLPAVAGLDGRGGWVRIGSGNSPSSGVVLVSVKCIGVVLVNITSIGVMNMLVALDVPQAELEKCADDAGKAGLGISNAFSGKGRRRTEITYKAMKIKAHNIFIIAHILTASDDSDWQLRCLNSRVARMKAVSHRIEKMKVRGAR